MATMTAIWVLVLGFITRLADAYPWEGLSIDVPLAEREMNAVYFARLRARYGDANVLPRSGMMHRRQTGSFHQSSGLAESGASYPTHSIGSSAVSPSRPLSNGHPGASSYSWNPNGTLPSHSNASSTSINIGATTTSETLASLPTTYQAGVAPAISGAPVLPTISIDPTAWPVLDRVPPTDSPQVKAWIASIDWSKVPDIPVNQLGGCGNTANAQAAANASANGWWTCSGQTRSTDITDCPNKMTWGLTYDDGPSPDTPRLLDYLAQKSLKSTFFAVGSRVISRPDILRYEYMAGHQIGVHTWSHPPLTTKTNEEIVAELGWTKEAIRQVLGVSVRTWRPPYGDIDDRVRAIGLQMGMVPVIWTSVNGITYNSQDWQIASGAVSADTVYSTFRAIIDQAGSLTRGFITLEHDLWQQSVSISTQWLLPYALNKTGLSIQPVYQCQGQSLADAYVETSSNSTPVPSTVDRGSSATAVASFPPSSEGCLQTGASALWVRLAVSLGGVGAIVTLLL